MRRRVKDLSGLNIKTVPNPEAILYHWSPTSNRNSINRYGLMPDKKSRSGDWQPPYICFSDDPMLAWRLSGATDDGIESWDLWMCYLDAQTSFDNYEVLTDTFADTGRHHIQEYRVYTRVYKRDLRYLGTRINNAHSHARLAK